MEENTRIFAMNSLIASMQIFNIKEKLQEDLLQVGIGAVPAEGLEAQMLFPVLHPPSLSWRLSIPSLRPISTICTAHASLHQFWRNHQRTAGSRHGCGRSCRSRGCSGWQSSLPEADGECWRLCLFFLCFTFLLDFSSLEYPTLISFPPFLPPIHIIVQFLIRDWEFPDHPPGAAGGQQYVDQYLSMEHHEPGGGRECAFKAES